MNNMLYISFELLLFIILVIYFSNYKNRDCQVKFQSFDYTIALRGIAILMVYLQHTMGGLGTRAFTPLGGAGVAIFLILSGYGLTESYKEKGLHSYWKKKIIHVFCPWWIIYLLFLQDWNHVTGWDIIGNMTLIGAKLWYMQYLFLWYVVFYLTHKCKIFHTKRYAIMSLVGFAVFIGGGDIQAEQAVSFVIGCLMSENKFNMAKCGVKKYNYIVVCSLIIALSTLATKQIPIVRSILEENNLLFHTLQMLLKTSIALATIYGLTYCQRLLRNRFIFFTGIISYELYLVHVVATPKIMQFLAIEQGLVYVFMFLSFSYLISWGYHLFNNKILMRIMNH